MTRTNYGCLGCMHCRQIVIDGDEWGHTCTHIDKGIAPNPLSDNMVYGYSIIIHMDGTVITQMFEKPPKCKKIRELNDDKGACGIAPDRGWNE